MTPFKFAYLVPDKYRHTIRYDFTDPNGSYLLSIDRHLFGKQFGVDVRLTEDELAMSDEAFAKSILVPAIAALVRQERAF